MTQDKTGLCPECEQKIQFSSPPKRGQKITCPHCWAYLEVTNLDPLELEWESIDLEDDWDQDWPEDDDE